ncbi:peroxidase P7-like [Carex rostrata]
MAFARGLLLLSLVSLLAYTSNAQLSAMFYAGRCPNLQSIVRSVMSRAVAQDPRMGASILRLFFHDCFVNGCDGSVLLDDTATFQGEKNAGPNSGSLRGFEVIDSIKSQVEASCGGVVSCADILALAAKDGVNLLGGPNWTVLLGRRDARTASFSAANSNLPGPSSSFSSLVSAFGSKGLSIRDLTALSGAHTIGQARCTNFRTHIYNDANVNPSFSTTRQQTCPQTGGDSNMAPLDFQSPNRFDNGFYQNIMNRAGLLHSDQELFNNTAADAFVRVYSRNSAIFANDFVSGMIRMGNISPLTGTNGEIRVSCRKTN